MPDLGSAADNGQVNMRIPTELTTAGVPSAEDTGLHAVFTDSVVVEAGPQQMITRDSCRDGEAVTPALKGRYIHENTH
ncbi:hypothetical protein N8H30_004390 [Salmonella enterica]|nr:hypothetical protein [Salmonella enterica]EJW0033301.1 hypothetical protein [Salmonella enterica]